MRGREHLSYHRWLWMLILVAGALVLAACSPSDSGGTATTAATGGEAPATTEAPAETPDTTAAPVEAITLDIEASQPEYQNAEEQIWDIFEAENPGVTVELFAVNEGQEEAYAARRAGGYSPAIEGNAGGGITFATAENYVDLLAVDTQWLDRWTYDVRTAQAEKLGTTGLRSLNVNSGFYMTWQYNKDLMDELGLDPRTTVVDQASLIQFLADGQALVDERDDIEFFWDEGWHNWVWGANFIDVWPLAYADGQRVPYQQDSWQGKIDDPAADPYRYTFQWVKDVYDAGLMPEEFWLREWETDMEASYIAGNSVMMLHGPWTWDKMLAENPDANQEGIPATPPEIPGDPWVQSVSPPNVVGGFKIPIENVDKPEWELILKAFNFWNSPEIVLLRAQIQGVTVEYTLDEPLVLEGPQYTGIIQEFQPGGFYEDVIIENRPTGQDLIAPFKNEDAGETWDWQWVDTWAAVMNDEMTVDEAVLWMQEQRDADFTLP
ncbi:MAG: ABC transporter substrate-binding protein [Pirellulaceae bacterium]